MIDLAVAAYGDDHDVLMDLWSRGDAALHMAIAASRFRGGLLGRDMMDVVRLGNDGLVQTVLENPGMVSSAIACVLRREAPLDHLTDAQWLVGIVAVARNPVLRV